MPCPRFEPVHGLGAGLLLVYVVQHTDDRLLSLKELSTRFEEWVIGQVPEVPKFKKTKRPAILDAQDTRHMFAESWRNLRSALLYLPVEGDRPKILLVTSAVPNEGKSTVAANLARALAFGGSKVLLVDGDLRKGTLDSILTQSRGPGLSDFLKNGAIDATKYMQTIDLSPSSALPSDGRGIKGEGPISDPASPPSGCLHLLSRGANHHNPGDLFLAPKLGETLKRWREEYDYVIIDSCPVFASDDATTLAPKVDGTLFVVRSHFTSANTAREALELLYARQAKVLGLILNRTDASARSYHYYKYKDYSDHSADT
jgi:Mrp family chromosome partitioning ATPase